MAIELEGFRDQNSGIVGLRTEGTQLPVVFNNEKVSKAVAVVLFNGYCISCPVFGSLCTGAEMINTDGVVMADGEVEKPVTNNKCLIPGEKISVKGNSVQPKKVS